ncbi:MAG: penicillin-binding protein 2 [Endomicrobium sp.]|jgi:cell division protein FtsI (penicillin-binding protein 3)|nr:penicillin-binding protein 2 [Endomicrobium sp.]
MRRNIKKHINRKTVLVLMVLAVFFLLFTKLVYIQIFLHDKIRCNVDKMVNRQIVEISKRGDILDTKGNILATSVKKYNIFLDPQVIEDFSNVKDSLFTNGIQIKEKDLNDFGNRAYVPIVYNVDSSIADNIRSTKLKGVGFESKYVRSYPEGKMLSNILGITGCDGNGLEGIEKICNNCLLGSRVTSNMHRDGRGYIIQNKVIDQSKICGQNVILSIDRNIQYIAEQGLRKSFEKYQAKKAICIVQNPKTGSILAMVSLPDFDHLEKIKDLKVLRNAAISDIYEPGSTFKIVTVASALEEGKVKLSDTFYLENGKLKIADHIIKDDHKIDGMVSLSRVMEMSSNIAMVKIAKKLGNNDFYEYIRKFGFYSLTGIDLPGEAKGLLLDIKEWNALTLPTISFGQGIGVTALQMINAFSAIANDGVLLKPYIVQKICNCNDDSPQKIFNPMEIRRVVSKETAYTIKKILKNAVDLGTGKSAKVKGYTVAGKTGTAQKIDPLTKTYSKKFYTASFCGMLPAMEPEFVILVIIDEPKGQSYYASSVASPVFASIAQSIAQYLEIPKDDLGDKKVNRKF